MAEASGLSNFFSEISKMVEEAERQYGLANRSYTEYIIERLEHSIAVCSNILDQLLGVAGLEEYCSCKQELIDSIKALHRKWIEYEDVIESYPMERALSYQLPVSLSGPGRPRFDITREQLEYLFSLSFKTTEVAALLGVSRMTVYRYANTLCRNA